MMRFSKPLLCLCAAIMAVLLLQVNRAGAESKAAPQTIRPPVLMVLGDSLVAGYGLPAEEAFPARLEQKLGEKGHAVSVMNAGVSGDTTADALNRLPWLLKQKTPDAAIVVIGGNDMLRALDPALTDENLQKILAVFRESHIPVLLAGMRAFANLGPEYAAKYAEMYKAAAENYGALYYPFFLDGVAAKPDLNQEDGIHPNAKGVDIIVDKMLPDAEKLLAKARAK